MEKVFERLGFVKTGTRFPAWSHENGFVIFSGDNHYNVSKYVGRDKYQRGVRLFPWAKITGSKTSNGNIINHHVEMENFLSSLVYPKTENTSN